MQFSCFWRIHQVMQQNNPELERALWLLFRDFFKKAERKRRWSLDENIPWERV